MQSTSKIVLFALAAAAVSGCNPAETPADSEATPEAPPLDYEPYASVLDLMRGTVTFAAETYWDSVMIIWDANGETIHQPETDEDWQEIWSAGVTLAESGNLLMLPRVGFPDDPEWIALSQLLKDAGIQAADAARRQDYMEVLDVGNTVYNACVACHEVFVPTLSRL